MTFSRYYVCFPVAYPGVAYDTFQVVDGHSWDGRLLKRVVTGIPDEDTARRLCDQMNRMEDPEGLSYLR